MSSAVPCTNCPYVVGITIGWWLGKKILAHISRNIDLNFSLKEFDDLIAYIIVSLIIGGRLGYIIFYNLEYYIDKNDIPKNLSILFSPSLKQSFTLINKYSSVKTSVYFGGSLYFIGEVLKINKSK